MPVGFPPDEFPPYSEEPSIMDLSQPMLPPGLPGPMPMDAVQPPLEDPPTEMEIDPPDATGKIRKEIVDWVKSYMKASREFTVRKERDYELWHRLYNGKITRSQWSNWYSGRTVEAMTRQELLASLTDEATEDWSEFVYAPTHMLDAWVDSAYPLLFNNSEYLLVIPDNPQGPNIEDIQYPTAKKLQHLLLAKLEEGRIHARGYDAIKSLAIFGSCYAKIIWFSKEVPRWKWDLEQIERVEDVNLVSECPILHVLSPEKVLIDPEAEHNDVNRFRGIGHWVEKPYSIVLEGFRRGAFKLNEAEFKRRFKDAGRKVDRGTGGPIDDPDKKNLGELSDESWVRIWELHNAAPTSDGLKENVTTIVTECGNDDPSNGLEIRVALGPILDCGLRPFLGAQFSPELGPFGKGQIERNVDLIFELSTLIGQFQDNVRSTAHSVLIVEEGSDADDKLRENGDKIIPGMIFRKAQGAEDPIKPLETSNFPSREVGELIQYYLSLLEKRMVSDTFQGVSQTEKSATESQLLFQQSMTPTQTRVDLFARQFLGPMGQISLAMLQQFLLEDQVITIRNDQGMDVPEVITSEELTSGRYRVVAALAKQDQQRVAKGNMIKEVLPMAERLKPIVMQLEGQDISVSELFKQFLHYADVEKIDKIIHPLPPPPPIDPNAPPGMGPPGMPPGMPPEMPPGGPPMPMAENGGPMGPIPTDANIEAQNIQMDRLRERGGRD